MGVLAVGAGKNELALPFFRTALEVNSSIAQFWYSYIDALIKLERLVDAKAVLDQARNKGAKDGGFNQLEQRLNDADAYYNMGIGLQEKNKLEEAIEAYNKALSIKPDYADAYHNMGITLKNQGKLDEAIEAYSKALSIKPNYAEAYNNIGVTLYEQGKLEEAIEVYSKALVIKPDYANAIENRLSLLTQIQGTVLSRSKKYKQITEDKHLEMIQTPKSHILHAISSFLSADEDRAQRHVHNFKTCASKLLDNLTPQDQLFCFAYSEYLCALLKKPLSRTLNLSTDNVVYHIGESHCLSYAHHNLEINGTTFRIVPMITFGAKVFALQTGNIGGHLFVKIEYLVEASQKVGNLLIS